MCWQFFWILFLSASFSFGSFFFCHILCLALKDFCRWRAAKKKRTNFHEVLWEERKTCVNLSIPWRIETKIFPFDVRLVFIGALKWWQENAFQFDMNWKLCIFSSSFSAYSSFETIAFFTVKLFKSTRFTRPNMNKSDDEDNQKKHLWRISFIALFRWSPAEL